MEAVKNQGQFLFGDSCACIFHGQVEFSALFFQGNYQIPLGVREFNGIIYEIVQHLGNAVFMRHSEEGFFGHIHNHIEVFLFEFALKGK